MAARRKKKTTTRRRSSKPAELIISKARTKAAVKKCNVGGEFYEALDKVVRELIKDADVVVQNMRPGVSERLGVGYESLAEVENLMLRTQPPEVYDAWVTNEIPFTDERVVAALDTRDASLATFKAEIDAADQLKAKFEALKAARAAAGGDRLARRPDNITLSEIVDAVEGSRVVPDKPVGGNGVGRALSAVWLQVQQAEREILHLPAYPEISDSKIDWIAERVRQAVDELGSQPDHQPAHDQRPHDAPE